MNPIELTQKIDVKATLMVVPEYGEARPATPDDLTAAGWIERESIYDRSMDVLYRIGINPEAGMGSTVRYLIEYASGFYAHPVSAETIRIFAPLVELVNGADEEDDD